VTPRPYQKYKPSGVEWFGDIPAKWQVKRLRYLLAQPVTDGPHLTPSFLPDGVPFISVDGIQDGELVFDGCRFVSREDHDAFSRKARPRRDDILMGKAASTGKIARVKVDFEFSIWSPLALIRTARSQLDPGFGEYCLKSKQVQSQIDVLCTHNTQNNISMADIPRLTLTQPPLPEQRAIADFLDHETIKIDTLVTKKRELIERLKENRTALITQAVTKGIDPNVPMKDSGIHWLGDVPAHWEVMPILRLASAIQTGPFGSQLHEADYVEGGIPLINPAHIVSGRLVPDDQSAVDGKTAARLSRHRLRTGDIVMARRGEMGRCAVVSAKEAGWLCGTGSLVIRLTGADPDYVGTILSSAGFSRLLELNAVGSTMLNLNPTIVGRMRIPVPPFPEQQAIADYLDRETEKIDEMVAKVEAAIEKVHEYRTALITAAVIGKIDVREVA
jgi:type I restriction enzyme S subunit